MNISACIQARMNSQRLPGKVLMEINGKPLIQWQIERLKRSKLIDDVIIATTSSRKDDPIEKLCKELGVNYFRGSEKDVLNRVSNTLKEFKVDIHVECFGDSPLVDPQIIDEFIDFFLKNSDKIDYLSSALKSSYPAGLETSIYKSTTLFEIDRMLKSQDPYREHVGFNITRYSEKYRLFSLEAPIHLKRPDIYLEVDTKNDFKLIELIINNFSKKEFNYFDTFEIINFLNKNPELIKINQDEERRWKLLRKGNKNLIYKKDL